MKMDLKKSDTNIPKYLKLEYDSQFKSLIFWFHDSSRIVISLNSGNPLFMTILTERVKEKFSHAYRYKKLVKCAEIFNNSICIEFKNGFISNYPFLESHINKSIKSNILENIKIKAAENIDKQCQIFVGNIYPDHYAFSLEKSTYSIVQPLFDQNEFNALLDIEIINNAVIATIWAQDHPIDLPYRIELVEGYVQDFLDIFSFTSGHNFTVAITRVLNINNQLIFERPKPVIEKVDSDGWLSHYGLIIKTCKGEKSWLIRFAIVDFRLATQHPLNTAFYCRRALESLVHHIVFTNQTSSKVTSKEWEELRSIISMDDDTFNEIKLYGGFERHGNSKGISTDHRTRFLNKTWISISEYIAWYSKKMKIY